MKRIIGVLVGLLVVLTAPLRAAVSVNLTIQEAIYSGGSTGVARTDEPVTVGIPLPDNASTGITGVSSLGLTGASVGQFRCLGVWPSGRCKWVLVDTLLGSLSAGASSTAVTLTNAGSGNFGGSDLATDNGSTITVATGAATFTIKKANFNGFDTVVVGSTTVVTTGNAGGLVVTGPTAGNTSCGTCATVYSSINDADSTCSIEENGPVRVALLCTGQHEDGSDHIYMKYTARLHFWKGKTAVKVVHSLRNAELGASNTFASAYKEFEAYDWKLVPTLSGTTTYAFGRHTGASPATCTGSLSTTDDAYINVAQPEAFASGTAHLFPGDTEDFPWYPHTAQTGYRCNVNGSDTQSGTVTQISQSWGNIETSGGVGVLVGNYQAAANYPKGVVFNDTGTDTRVGIWPASNDNEFWAPWPLYTTHTLFFVFHDATLSSNENEFLKLQHPLIARAPLAHYNSAAVFDWPFLDAASEDAWYTALDTGESPEYTGSTCCLADLAKGDTTSPVVLYRWYGWNKGGASNQFDRDWSYLIQWLIRGHPGRYVTGTHFYGQYFQSAFYRSDGFTWRSQIGATGSASEPTAVSDNYPDAVNTSKTRSGFVWIGDNNHAHIYGLYDYYFMTGDEGAKDFILDFVPDYFLNAVAYTSTGQIAASRGVSHYLVHVAKAAEFFNAIGDSTTADAIVVKGDNAFDTQVDNKLCANETPIAMASCDSDFVYNSLSTWSNGDPGTKNGYSRTRGIHLADQPTGGAYIDPGCAGTDGVRTTGHYFAALFAMGMMKYADFKGTGWSGYWDALDFGYGHTQWMQDEQYKTVGNGRWDEDGYRYGLGLDVANCDDIEQPLDGGMVVGPRQTLPMAFYSHWRTTGEIASLEPRIKIAALRMMAANGGLKNIDYGSAPWNALIYRIVNPGTTTLQDVSFARTDNGGGSYTLTWTPPTGAQSYRVKWTDKASIVTWIGFDPFTNTWVGDPTTQMPWSGAENVSTTPTCGGTCSVTLSTGTAGWSAGHFSVKAYTDLTSSGAGPRVRIPIRREQ